MWDVRSWKVYLVLSCKEKGTHCTYKIQIKKRVHSVEEINNKNKHKGESPKLWVNCLKID